MQYIQRSSFIYRIMSKTQEQNHDSEFYCSRSLLFSKIFLYVMYKPTFLECVKTHHIVEHSWIMSMQDPTHILD